MDYYRSDGQLLGLPIRWMAWESVIQVSGFFFNVPSTNFMKMPIDGADNFFSEFFEFLTIFFFYFVTKQGKYTTKSDVWAFAVTLWEILVLARQRPFAELDDEAVAENLHRFSQGTAPIVSLSKPQHCPRDIYDLMCECWRRLPTERPSFREIHLFLQRKNLGYSPT